MSVMNKTSDNSLLQQSNIQYSNTFLGHLQQFNKFLVEIIEKSAVITLTLAELSTLQSVKSLLDKVHYLNMVYQENSRLK